MQQTSKILSGMGNSIIKRAPITSTAAMQRLGSQQQHSCLFSPNLWRATATPLHLSGGGGFMGACWPMRGFAYHERVIDHYENPRNVGSLDKQAEDVGTGLVGAPACGDVMKLQIKVNEKNGKIEQAVFKTFGCGSAIASSSYATELLQGMDIEEAVKIKNQDIASHLKLPPVKLHCSMLAEDAIQAAIKDYKTKK